MPRSCPGSNVPVQDESGPPYVPKARPELTSVWKECKRKKMVVPETVSDGSSYV
jgi:hypothetical protein